MLSIKAHMEYERQSETIQLLSQLDSPEKSAKLGSPQGTYLIASKGTFFSQQARLHPVILTFFFPGSLKLSMTLLTQLSDKLIAKILGFFYGQVLSQPH